jgi:hypothetical protein
VRARIGADGYAATGGLACDEVLEPRDVRGRRAKDHRERGGLVVAAKREAAHGADRRVQA